MPFGIFLVGGGVDKYLIFTILYCYFKPFGNFIFFWAK